MRRTSVVSTSLVSLFQRCSTTSTNDHWCGSCPRWPHAGHPSKNQRIRWQSRLVAVSAAALGDQRLEVGGEPSHPQSLGRGESRLAQCTSSFSVSGASADQEHPCCVVLRAGNPGPASHSGVLGEGRLKVRLGL